MDMLSLNQSGQAFYFSPFPGNSRDSFHSFQSQPAPSRVDDTGEDLTELESSQKDRYKQRPHFSQDHLVDDRLVRLTPPPPSPCPPVQMCQDDPALSYPCAVPKRCRGSHSSTSSLPHQSPFQQGPGAGAPPTPNRDRPVVLLRPNAADPSYRMQPLQDVPVDKLLTPPSSYHSFGFRVSASSSSGASGGSGSAQQGGAANVNDGGDSFGNMMTSCDGDRALNSDDPDRTSFQYTPSFSLFQNQPQASSSNRLSTRLGVGVFEPMSSMEHEPSPSNSILHALSSSNRQHDQQYQQQQHQQHSGDDGMGEDDNESDGTTTMGGQDDTSTMSQQQQQQQQQHQHHYSYNYQQQQQRHFNAFLQPPSAPIFAPRPKRSVAQQQQQQGSMNRSHHQRHPSSYGVTVGPTPSPVDPSPLDMFL